MVHMLYSNHPYMTKYINMLTMMMSHTQGKYAFGILPSYSCWICKVDTFLHCCKIKAFIAFATFNLSSLLVFFGLITLLDPFLHQSFNFKATFDLSSSVFIGLMTLLDPSFHLSFKFKETFDLSSFMLFGLMRLLDPSFQQSFKCKATLDLSSFMFFGLMTLLDPSFHQSFKFKVIYDPSFLMFVRLLIPLDLSFDQFPGLLCL